MNATAQGVIRPLDPSDPVQIEQFERLFYAGFERASHNRLVRWLWEWDDAARRLRTRIPYADQRLWGVQGERGTPIGGIAVNVTLRTLQAAAYGFELPPELIAAGEHGRVCEFLAFFAIQESSFSRLSTLWKELVEDLRADGFTHAVATTAPKILPLYRWAGAKCLGEIKIDGEIRFFLLFDLRRATRNSIK